MWVRFRTAMLWWSVPQLDQPVSNKSMTARSYQMSSIRPGSWESATWIQNCSTRTQFSSSIDHKLHTNVHMRVDTKRSVTQFFQFSPPTIEDSHFILLVLCSNRYTRQKYAINWIFEKLKYELVRASHHLTAQTMTVLWHWCHKSTRWRNDDMVATFPCEKRVENSFQSSKLQGTTWLNPSNMPWRIWVS